MKYEKRVREVSKMQEHEEEASGVQKGQTQDTVEARQADQFGQNIKLEAEREIRLQAWVEPKCGNLYMLIQGG